MRFVVVTVVLLLLFTGCASQSTDPADVVERYLQAKVEGSAETIQQLLCLPLEATLEREVSSFASVTNARIVDMDCQSTAGSDIVQCSGTIVATYGSEDTPFPLTSYRVVQEDGEWKWCGEAG